MPVLEIRHISDNNILGIWKIQEEPEELLKIVRLNSDEKEYYSSFTNALRRKHWLSYRMLIQEMTKGKCGSLYYDENGKLFPGDRNFHLSVSHSGDYSTVIINRANSTGIDIEKISPRILKIAPRFMSDYEMTSCPPENAEAYLCTCWAIKEAIYKYHGKKGIDFKTQIRIENFTYNLVGQTSVSILNSNPVDIQFETVNDYVLAFTL
ncbi:MAG: 4'-phosphopantetheinyl transferase superfamily protein [Bacteroidales bacterium]|jgi:phosphopantetheine--protein transferase-like protein|nr:4'-phosphopantetheinyl transferase superfamily protein [Bacteroidales bacterium]